MHLWHNGKIIEEQELRISPFDHGYLYGMGLFETFRTYDGHPFLFDDHIERLQISCAALGITLPYSREELRAALDALTELNGPNLYFRLNVSAGPREIGLSTAGYLEPEVIFFVKDTRERTEIERPMETVRLPRSGPETTYRLKSHHYMNNLVAKRQLFDSSAEGLFLTSDGFVCEGITSNVFWRTGNKWFTPPLSTGALNGITRQFIMERIQVEERFALLPQLLDADEIVYTNSIQEAVAVSSLDGRPFPGTRGKGYRELRELFDKEVSHSLSRRERV